MQDKAYISKQLALPAEARNMKVKTKLPVPSIAVSGRWAKQANGEWGFDFDGESASGPGAESDSDSEEHKTLHQADSINPAVSTSSSASINLVLRMRDEKKELQDIKFEFLPNKDTVDEISHELVNAKLIDAIDMVAVSANLNKLLENHSLSPITFPLVIQLCFKIIFFIFQNNNSFF